MKRITLLLTLFVVATQLLLAQGTPKMEFKENCYDFKYIKESDGDAVGSLEFTNTGDAPLIIFRGAASCGCTVPEFSKEPIAPGKNSQVKITYHAKGRHGSFTKNVYLYTNVQDKPIMVTIKGVVIE